jgi:hypothetical protein
MGGYPSNARLLCPSSLSLLKLMLGLAADKGLYSVGLFMALPSRYSAGNTSGAAR